MIIDQIFLLLCVVCLFLNKDGRVVGFGLGCSLIFSYESGLYAPYCLFFSACLFYALNKVIKSNETRVAFLALMIFDILSFLDYFNMDETALFLLYPSVVFIIKSMLILSIFKGYYERRNNADDSPSAYDAFFWLKSYFFNIKSKSVL